MPIKDKDKHYSKNEKENLILIIEGFMPTPRLDEIKKNFKQYNQLDFKGIYYVSLPVISSTRQEYEEKGYVVVIKEAKL